MKKTLLALSSALLLTTVSFAQDAERAKIENIVKEYLLKNPEIIAEAMAALERKQAEAEDKARAEVLLKSKDLLNNPKGALVFGNPKGDVTLVEFFDYNCGFCKRGFTDVQNLMKADKNVRVIQLDFPVLGQGSQEAARVAVAVKMQATAEKYAIFHEKLLMGRGQANHNRAMEVAKDVGFDIARLEKDLASPEVAAIIKGNLVLGDSLKISGTPSYIVGDDVLVGAVGLAAIQARIETTRKTVKK